MNTPPAKAGGIEEQLKLAIAAKAARTETSKGNLFAFNLEVVVIVALLLNIGLDDLVGDIAAAAAKVSPCPKVASPILTPKRFKTMKQLIGTFAF